MLGWFVVRASACRVGRSTLELTKRSFGMLSCGPLLDVSESHLFLIALLLGDMSVISDLAQEQEVPNSVAPTYFP